MCRRRARPCDCERWRVHEGSTWSRAARAMWAAWSPPSAGGGPHGHRPGRPVHRLPGGRARRGRPHGGPDPGRRRVAGRLLRRRAALRRLLAGRRVGGEAREVLGEQRRRHRSRCSAAMRAAGVRRLVFSSTAATYGEPEPAPDRRATPDAPTNPYGASKLAVDHMITGEAAAHGLGGDLPALLQRGGRRTAPRRAARPRVPPDPAGAPGRPGPPRRRLGLRRRLPDARRHLRPRLHPCRRPRRGPPARASTPPPRAST